VKKKLIIFLFILVILSSIGLFYKYGVIKIIEYKWIKSYERLEKASDIVDYLIEHYTFKTTSTINPGYPPVGTDFGPVPTVVIYTIIDQKEQDRIISIIKKYMSDNNIKTVTIMFYEKENWIAKKDSSGNVIGGHQGEAKLIRTVTLK